MFQTILLTAGLWETLPKRKHKHITRILQYTNGNTIEVYTREGVVFTFNNNYINNVIVLKNIVDYVNLYFNIRNTKISIDN